MKEENKDIKFIARHYNKGLFAVRPALRRIKGIRAVWWTRARIAAAITVAAVLTATASVFVYNSYISHYDPTTTETEYSYLPAVETVRVIDFENTSLTIVVAKIKEVYGVDVVNLPANANEYSLSLHYEGTAIDLVDTINDILDTEMTIQE